MRGIRENSDNFGLRRPPIVRAARNRNLLATAVLAALGIAPSLNAATFTVDNTADHGLGTLRQAMLDANGIPGPHAITFALPPGSTIGLTTGQIEMDAGDITIAGPGREQLTISGSHASRIFHVKAGVLRLSSMTLRDGLALGDDSNERDQRGGAILVGEPASPPPGEAPPPGSSLPTLKLEDVAILDSAAYSPRDGGGGAIFLQGGALTADHCLMQGNFARRAGGAFQARFGTVQVSNSEFIGNTADYSARSGSVEGGAIEINRSAALISRSIVRGNALTGPAEGAGSGAGVALLMQGEPVQIRSTEISDNTGTEIGLSFGGGIQCHLEPDGTDPRPVLSVINSTVSGNVALVGGIEAGCSMELVNSTITNNTGADYLGEGIAGGIETYSPNTTEQTQLTLQNTILSGNLGGPDLHRYLYPGYADPAILGSRSIIGTSDLDIVLPAGTLVGVDPMLAPLADNGGATRTHALLSGSPAIDAGGDVIWSMLFDQRGVGYPRKLGPAVDIGAFEHYSAAARLPPPQPPSPAMAGDG